MCELIRVLTLLCTAKSQGDFAALPFSASALNGTANASKDAFAALPPSA